MLKNCFFLFVFFSIYICEAQKVAYVDSKYILNNIPEFTSAQEEIEDLSKSVGRRNSKFIFRSRKDV